MSCMRHGHCHEGTEWTVSHLKWPKKPELSPMHQETTGGYPASYDEQSAEMERSDARIEETAFRAGHAEKAKKPGCFPGIKTHTALSLIAETGDLERSAKGNVHAACLGLAPGEHPGAAKANRLGITGAGNSHPRLLLIEARRGYLQRSCRP